MYISTENDGKNYWKILIKYTVNLLIYDISNMYD